MSLKWLPIPLHLWIPDHFQDYEVGWFVKLLAASLRSETPGMGYLPVNRDLWLLAGACSKSFFEQKNGVVMAGFEGGQIGPHRVLFFPPLVAVINQQLKKIRNKKPREGGISTISTAFHSGAGFSLPLSFDFDVGSKEEKDAKKPNQFTQADFDARDLRKMHKACDELNRNSGARIGTKSPSDKEFFEMVCIRAGITVKRGLQLEKLQTQWPEENVG